MFTAFYLFLSFSSHDSVAPHISSTKIHKTCLHGPKGTLQLAGFLNKLLLWQAIYYNPSAACWGEK